ncbi:hypothetical protein [Gracilimonas sp.]|uniref:hypothetical protein n=1 Tax=Gracilimonas sp. TaxID=1974203 RepID=UPI002871A229|nr:hypothetical protein [Gracilimonas sp.]
MRQIQQLSQVLGRVIAAVIGLKGSGQTQQAIEITNKALNEELKLDIDALLEMKPEEMLQFLEEKEGMNEENLERVADLFLELGKKMKEEQIQPEKMKVFFRRALQIYTYIEGQGNIYSIDRNHKIQKLNEMLE